MTDFPALLRALAGGGVDFIIVGGFAGTLHGSAIPTRDLDVVYSREPGNIERLVGALSAHSPYPRGAPPGLPFRWDRDTVRTGLNFTLITDLGAIDLLGRSRVGEPTKTSCRTRSVWRSSDSSVPAYAWRS